MLGFLFCPCLVFPSSGISRDGHVVHIPILDDQKYNYLTEKTYNI